MLVLKISEHMNGKISKLKGSGAIPRIRKHLYLASGNWPYLPYVPYTYRSTDNPVVTFKE